MNQLTVNRLGGKNLPSIKNLLWFAFTVLVFAFTSARCMATPTKNGSNNFTLVGNTSSLIQQAKRARAAGARSISPIIVHGKIPGAGQFRAQFTSQRFHTALLRDAILGKPVPVLLQGTLSIGGNSYAAASSIYRGTLELSFPALKVRSIRNRSRLYTVRIPLSKSTSARLVSRPSVSIPGKLGCGTEDSPSKMVEQVIRARDGGDSTKDVRVATIVTDADQFWYEKFGENSNIETAKIINFAEAVFDRQLNVRFDLVGQHVYKSDSPYPNAGTQNLFQPFMSNPDNPSNFGFAADIFDKAVDLKHLFSAIPTYDGILGIALKGALCLFPDGSYGVTSYHGGAAFVSIVATHEIAHNFNASHDLDDLSSIMGGGVPGAQFQYFSNVSVVDMNSHIQEFGTCLDKVTRAIFTPTPIPTPTSSPTITPTPAPTNTPSPPAATPSPTPTVSMDVTVTTNTTVKIRRSKVRIGRTTYIKISGRELNQNKDSIPGTSASLFVANKNVGGAVADSSGEFVFLVRVTAKKGKKLSAYVQSGSTTKRSSRFTLERPAPLNKPTRGASVLGNWTVVTVR